MLGPGGDGVEEGCGSVDNGELYERVVAQAKLDRRSLQSWLDGDP